MELYQLRTFVAVAEEGHLTRASERLYISQPSVSAHIKALEHELDIKLFIRTPKGMQLTQAGMRIKRHADEMLHLAGAIEEEARSLQDQLVGELRIGLNIDSGFLRMVPILSHLGEKHPRIVMRLHQSSSNLVQDDIRSGKADGGFIFGRPRFKDIAAFHLADIEYNLAFPKDWEDRVIDAPIEELAKLPWIKEEHESPFQPIMDQFFATAANPPSYVFEVDGDEIIKVLVASGKGVSLLREDEVKTMQRLGHDIGFRKLEGISLPLYFAYMRRREEEPVLRAFISEVQSVWENSS